MKWHTSECSFACFVLLCRVENIEEPIKKVKEIRLDKLVRPEIALFFAVGGFLNPFVFAVLK